MATKNTIDLTNLSADEMQAELRRREQEANERRSRKIEAREAEEVTQYTRFVDGYADLDDNLVQAEKAAQAAFEAAVSEGTDYLKHFVEKRALHWQRSYLRDTYVNAREIAGKGRKLPDLSYRDFRLVQDLEQAAEKAARRLAAERADEITDPMTEAINNAMEVID